MMMVYQDFQYLLDPLYIESTDTPEMLVKARNDFQHHFNEYLTYEGDDLHIPRKRVYDAFLDFMESTENYYNQSSQLIPIEIMDSRDVAWSHLVEFPVKDYKWLQEVSIMMHEFYDQFKHDYKEQEVMIKEYKSHSASEFATVTIPYEIRNLSVKYQKMHTIMVKYFILMNEAMWELMKSADDELIWQEINI
jgi:hypothetical protein